MLRAPVFLVFLAALTLLSGGMANAAPNLSPGGATPHISASLQAETPRPAPGARVTLAIVMRPEAGWHGYWQNPGDAGKPIDLQWQLPKGIVARPPQYPVPRTLLIAGLMNHVYEGPYAVLVDVTVGKDLKAGTALPIRLHANWLACTETICVPERGDLSIDLAVGEGKAGTPENRSVFDSYRTKLPRPLGGEAVFQQQADRTVRIAIPYPRSAEIDEPHFFLLAEGAKSYAAPQSFNRDGDRLTVTMTGLPKLAASLQGVLRIGPDKGLAIDARQGVVRAPPRAAESSDTGGWSAILLALAGAVAGGLLLNIMPCVFPILSLKAMSLIRSAHSPGEARHEAWAYTAGVMLTCMALGAAVLGLRAAGNSVGWAFQLQNPAVILILLGLAVALTLNLLGVYRFAALQIDGARSTGSGLAADFWSGVLVAFVATPCTGPFMATALGAALLLPVAAALAVFAGLGLGIALPFLLLGHFSALRRAIPRPGPWMQHVQRWLALPMALTGAALLWLLMRQAGTAGLTIGVALVPVLGVILWLTGKFQRGEVRLAGLAGSIAAIFAATAAAALIHTLPFKPETAAEQGSDARFSEASLAQARRSGRPVFVYFTADWCLSCKVNEAAAIDRAEVRSAFAGSKVIVLEGDWTNGDPAITRFLEAHGRSGVPLYLWFPPDGGKPSELPQILTPSLLISMAQGAR